MKNKKTLVVVLGIFGIIFATVGVTYAFFSYSRTGIKENKISSGAITFLYTEASQGISLNDAMPMTDAQGKVQNNYFEFTIDSKTSDLIDIPYYITAVRSGTGTNMDSIVKVYLTKVDENNNETEVLLSKVSELGTYTHTSINTTSDMLLHIDRVYAGTASYNQKYRLRMWIDTSANFIVQNNGVDTYPYEGKTYTLKVNVYSNGESVTQNQTQFRENVDIDDIEIGSNVVTSDTNTLNDTEIMPVGQETMQKTITINTTNPDSIVTIENLTPTTSMNSKVKRISNNHTIDLKLGTNTFKITISSVTGKTEKEYTLVIVTEYPSYNVEISGNNLTFGNNNINVKYNDTNTVTVRPTAGYYLASAVCSNGYTTNATVGTSATSQQTVTISNNGNEGGSECLFTATKSVYSVSFVGENVSLGSEGASLGYGDSTTVTVTPNTGYFLSSVSCTNNYTDNAQEGTNQTVEQTVTISNNNKIGDSTCTFTASPYFTNSSEIDNAFETNSSNKVVACNISNNRYYNCAGYSSLQNAFNSRNTGYAVMKSDLTTSSTTTLSSSRIFTLDFYGHTLTISNTDTNNGRAIVNNGSLTINNSTTTVGGINAIMTALAITKDATMNINGGLYTSETGDAINNNGTTNINGGTYISTNGFGILNANSNNSHTININQISANGPIYIKTSNTSTSNSAIYNGNKGTINVSGSPANNCTDTPEDTTVGLCVYSKTKAINATGDNAVTTINGGTFVNTNSVLIFYSGGANFSIYGGTYITSGKVIENNTTTGSFTINQTSAKGPIYMKGSNAIYNKNTGTIKISGSQANNCTATPSDTTSGLCIYAPSGSALNNNSSGTISVNGGTYTSRTNASFYNSASGTTEGTIKVCSAVINASTTALKNDNANGKIYYTNNLTVNQTTSGDWGNGVGTISKNNNITCN